MHKKIIPILVSMLFIITVISINVFAGSEEDPEITDVEDDIFGSFIKHPIRYQLFHAIGLLNMDNFDFLDIKSAWFYEESDEPEYLFASIKLNDLDVVSQRVVYSIHWKLDGERYAVGSHLYNDGLNSSCFVGFDRHFSLFSNFKPAEVFFDLEEDIVTFKFSKLYAGDLQVGDILTDTWAWAALRFNYEPMTILFSDGELVKDAAPFIEDDKDYGRDYVIQY
jgi:hypothetical protein